MMSIRTYFASGTVAVVGAGAIAMVPTLPAQPPAPAALPAPAVAEIALTGVTLPFTDIIGVLQTLTGLGGSLSGVLTDFLPQQFVNDVITEVLNQAGPLMTVAAGEVFGYLGSALAGLPGAILAGIGDAAGNIPTVLAVAVEALSTGDIATAVQAVTTGLAAPLTVVGQTIAAAARDFQEFLTGELDTIVGALPGILLAALQTVIGNNLQATIESVTGALSGLFPGLLPAAASESVAVAALPASAAVTPRSAATVAVSQPAAEPAEEVVEAAVTEVPSSRLAQAAQPVEAVTRVARPRAAAAVPESAVPVVAADTVTTRPTSTVRGARQGALRSSEPKGPRARQGAN